MVSRNDDVDSGWAWISLVASCCCYGLLAYIYYSVGMFHVALIDKYEEGQALTSAIGAISLSLLSLSGPLVGIVINATSCRVAEICGGVLVTLGLSLSFVVTDLKILLLTFGVITGIGLCFCSIPTYVMTGYSFDKYRGIAVGIVFAGGGIGMFASGPLTQTILETYGLNGAFLFVGGLTFHIVFFGALMRPSKLEIFHQNERKKTNNFCKSMIDIFDRNVLLNKAFLLILLSALLWHGTISIVTIYLPNYAVVRGSSKMDASFLIIETGIGMTISRILAGLLSGKESGVDPILFNTGAIGITGLITLLLPFYSSSFWEQSLFAVMYGIYSGTLMTLILPVAVEIVGLSKLPSGVGLTNFAGGIGSIFCPIIAGLLVDKTGQYDYCFYFAVTSRRTCKYLLSTCKNVGKTFGNVCGTCSILGFLAVLCSTIWRPKDIEKTNGLVKTSSLQGSNIIYSSGFLAGSIPFELNTSHNSEPGAETHKQNIEPLLKPRTA